MQLHAIGSPTSAYTEAIRDCLKPTRACPAFVEPPNLEERHERDWPTDWPNDAQSMKKPPAVRGFLE